MTGAIWTAEAVADYVESAAATFTRINAAELWPDAMRRLGEARRADPSLTDDAAKNRWFRTHYPPPSKVPAVVSRPPVVEADDPWQNASKSPPPAAEAPANQAPPKRKPGRPSKANESRDADAAMSEKDRDAVAILRDRSAPAADLVSDTDWVYANLGAFRAGLLTPEDAPSLGAWGLMLHAAENPSKFYADVVNKVAKVKQADEEQQKKFKDDGRTVFELLDRLDPTGKTAGLGLVPACS